MPALGFTDQRGRLRRIVENALAGAVYESSREEEERQLLIEARREDGSRVYLRFRGVERSDSTATPTAGSPLRLAGVGGSGSAIDLILPWLRLFRARSNAVRVRIEVGAARLDIVCEDAEWWEEAAANPANGDGV